MLKNRLEKAMEHLQTLPMVKPVRPDGAFYLWLDISQTIGKSFHGTKIESSREFASILLEKYYVAAVPGVEFGVEGFMRISFAIETERMIEAIKRMKDMISQLN